MSKELEEALEFVKMLLKVGNSEKHLLNLSSTDIRFEIIKIEKALTELKSIKEANPSEALECLEKIIDNLDDYADFEIKQEANEYTATIKQALQRLESIDNSNPSEALEVLCFMGGYIIPTANGNKYLKDFCNREFTTIKQALLKAQEPKKYLKWEDLEFKITHKIRILMNDNLYNLFCYDEKYIEIRTIKGEFMLTLDNDNPEDKQFFNDLHLERVGE